MCIVACVIIQIHDIVQKAVENITVDNTCCTHIQGMCVFNVNPNPNTSTNPHVQSILCNAIHMDPPHVYVPLPYNILCYKCLCMGGICWIRVIKVMSLSNEQWRRNACS